MKNISNSGVIKSEKGNVIWATDSGAGISITNDAERVVEHLVNTFGDFPIIYCDTSGNWDQLQHANSTFQGFNLLFAKSREEAILKL